MNNMQGTIKLTRRIPSKFEIEETRKSKATKLISKIFIFVICLFYAFLLLLPFYTIFISSITPLDEIYSQLQFIWFPEEITFEAYSVLFFEDPLSEILGMPSIFAGFLNTLWSVLLTTIISLFVSGLAAFAYSKMHFKGKEALFMFELITMMIPTATLSVPTLIFYQSLGWTNTMNGWLPMIIPSLFGGATTIFFFRSFMSSIPTEIIEAGKIDGLGPFRTYVQIVIPQAMPAFIAQFIFAFVGGYNNYMGPLLYLYPNEPSAYTLQLVMSEFSQFFPYPNQQCAGALLALLPLILIYIIFQRFFIEGISIGGGKE